jgi:hypothetical protein
MHTPIGPMLEIEGELNDEIKKAGYLGLYTVLFTMHGPISECVMQSQGTQSTHKSRVGFSRILWISTSAII